VLYDYDSSQSDGRHDVESLAAAGLMSCSTDTREGTAASAAASTDCDQQLTNNITDTDCMTHTHTH